MADLKKELKARGLSVSGSKIELVERLQEATQGIKSYLLNSHYLDFILGILFSMLQSFNVASLHVQAHTSRLLDARK